MNNALNLNGNTLTKTGDGELAIRNDLLTNGGTVNVQQGIVSGNGTISGDVTNDGGIISPGNASSVSAVPEPVAAVSLLVAVLLALSIRRHPRLI